MASEHAWQPDSLKNREVLPRISICPLFPNLGTCYSFFNRLDYQLVAVIKGKKKKSASRENFQAVLVSDLSMNEEDKNWNRVIIYTLWIYKSFTT